MLDPVIRTLAMIFTPCVEGITRNDNEGAVLAYTAPGVNGLLHTAVVRESVTER